MPQLQLICKNLFFSSFLTIPLVSYADNPCLPFSPCSLRWTGNVRLRLTKDSSDSRNVWFLTRISGDESAQKLNIHVQSGPHDNSNRMNMLYWSGSINEKGTMTLYVDRDAGLVIQNARAMQSNPWTFGDLTGPDHNLAVVDGLEMDGAVLVLTRPFKIPQNVQIGVGSVIQGDRCLRLGPNTVWVIDEKGTSQQTRSEQPWVSGSGSVVIERGSQLYFDDKERVLRPPLFASSLDITGWENLTAFDTLDPTWAGVFSSDGTLLEKKIRHSGPLASLATAMWEKAVQDDSSMPAKCKAWIRQEVAFTKDAGVPLEILSAHQQQSRAFRHELRTYLQDVLVWEDDLTMARQEWLRQELRQKENRNEEKDSLLSLSFLGPWFVNVDIESSQATDSFDTVVNFPNDMNIDRQRFRMQWMMPYGENMHIGMQLQGVDRDVRIDSLVRVSRASTNSVGLDAWARWQGEGESFWVSVGWQQSQGDWTYNPILDYRFVSQDEKNRWLRASLRYTRTLPDHWGQWGVTSMLFYRLSSQGNVGENGIDYFRWDKRDRWGAAMGLDWSWENQWKIMRQTFFYGIRTAGWLTNEERTQTQYALAWDSKAPTGTMVGNRDVDYLFQVQGHVAWQSEKSLWRLTMAGQQYGDGHRWQGQISWSRAW